MNQMPDPGPVTCAEAMTTYQGMLDHPVASALIILLAGLGAYFVVSHIVKVLWLIGRGLYSSLYFSWKGKPL